jgi:hypothetical protein
VMKDIKLPEFDTPDDVINLRDIVESYAKKYSSWAKRLPQVTDIALGEVQQFLEHPISTRAVLQQLGASLIKYQTHAVEIREVYALPMEQHLFPWAQTCEEFFIIRSEYEKSHPFKGIS